MEKSIEKPSFLPSVISSTTVVTVALVAAVFASLFAIVSSAQNRVELYPPGVELTTGGGTPNVLLAYDEYADIKAYAAAAVRTTEGCKELQNWEPVIVSRPHWRSLYAVTSGVSQTGVLAVAADSNCVQLGKPAHIAEFDRATGLTTTLGWFMPTGIAFQRPEFAAQGGRLLASAGLLAYRGPVAFISGRVMSGYASDGIGHYAPRMAGVRIIDRKQMESAIQDGIKIVDVRTKKQFAAGHVKGAVHVPYTTGPRMKVFDQYSEYVKSGDAFDIRRVDQNKQNPVILMGEGPFSDNVHRAAVVLRSEGWKRVFIFFEGFDYFTKMVWKPPVASGLFETINRGRVIASLREERGAKLIDVRSDIEFLDGSIPGSVISTYRERDDLRLRRAALNGIVLKQYGDTWVPPLNANKNEPIILIGRDEFDWRSYKAALIAKSLGFRKIYWYRLGVEGWKMLNVEEPKTYPVMRAGK